MDEVAYLQGRFEKPRIPGKADCGADSQRAEYSQVLSSDYHAAIVPGYDGVVRK